MVSSVDKKTSFCQIAEWAKLFHEEKESSDKSFACIIKSFDVDEKKPFEFRAKGGWFSQKIFHIIQSIKRVVGYRTYDLSYQLEKFLTVAKNIPESDVRNYLSNHKVGSVLTEIKDFVVYLEKCSAKIENPLTDELKSVETKLTDLCSAVALEKFREQLGDAVLEISPEGEVGYRVSGKKFVTNSEIFKNLEIDDVEMKNSTLKKIYCEKTLTIKKWIHQALQEWRKPSPLLFEYGKSVFEQIEKAFTTDQALAEHKKEIGVFFSKEINDRCLEILKLLCDGAEIDDKRVRVVFDAKSTPFVEIEWGGKWRSLDTCSETIVSENLLEKGVYKQYWKDETVKCLAASLKNREVICDTIAQSIVETCKFSAIEEELDTILHKKSDDQKKIKEECEQVLRKLEESGRVFLDKSLEFCENNQMFLPEKTGETIVRKFLEIKGKCISKAEKLGNPVFTEVVIHNAKVEAQLSENELENGLQDVKKIIEKKEKVTTNEKKRLHEFLDEIISIAKEIEKTDSPKNKENSEKLIDTCIREKEKLEGKPLALGKITHLKYVLKDSPGSTVAMHSKVGKDIVVGATPNLVVESEELEEGSQDYDEIYIENCPGAVVVYDAEIGNIIDQQYANTVGKVVLTFKEKVKGALLQGLVGGVAGATMGWMSSSSVYGMALGFLGGSVQAFLSFIPKELGVPKGVSTVVVSTAIFTSTLFLRKQILSFGKQPEARSGLRGIFDYFKEVGEAKKCVDAVGVGVLAGAMVS